MKKIILALILFPLLVNAQRDWSAMTVTDTELAPGIHRLFVGTSVSVVAQVGDEGILLIDAAYEQTAPQLRAALEALTDKPVRFLVNTHIHGDHTGGNTVFGQGADIISHHNVKTFLATERTQGERVIPAFPEHAQPNLTFSDELHMYINGEPVRMLHLPEGHTNSDIIIHFQESKVLVVGDLLFADNFPYVDTGNGGHPMGFLKNLGFIIENFPSDVVVSGGHGPVYTMQQFAQYKQTLQQTVVAVARAKQQGMTAAQMKENRILKQWESMGLFFITEDRWIDTLFPYL